MNQQIIAILPEFTSVIVLSMALLLDKIFGEAKHFHYLVGFGCLVNKVESKLNPLPFPQATSKRTALKTKLLGTTAWALLVLPLPALYYYFATHLAWYWQLIADSAVLYLAIGLTSLHQHAMQIYQPLKAGNLTKARHFTGYIVSRETSALTEHEMSRATVESMLENGHDAVIASLVYYLIGGAPLVILHRLANTLDAMWGYKNARFIHFGYASARLDDLLGFLSGKCCTLLYALQGMKQGFLSKAILNAYQQGNQYKSHNGGWVMAAGATVMSRKLGGSALYHGKMLNTVTLGCNQDITADDIPTSLKIVSRASLLCVAIVFSYQLISWLLYS
ncbi:MAG: cobalamin biosynthesis protein [Colwellia sp.]|nr:cobalamin biosynthesis protein [Colwellia sp.]